MKRLLFLIPWLFGVLVATAQTSTLPSSMGTFTVFKEAPVPVTIVMPTGYSIVSPVVEVWNNNIKLSDSTQVTIAGDTIKFALTKQQIAPLNRNPYFFVKVGGSYILGAALNPTIGVGVPSAQSKIISLPSSGTVRVNVIGDAGTAVSAAASASVSKIAAEAARVAAESARDASLIQGGVFVSRSAGRAAVADGQAFKVQGSGDVAAYEYRRVNSSTDTLITTYPSLQATTYGNTALAKVIPIETKFFSTFSLGYFGLTANNASANVVNKALLNQRQIISKSGIITRVKVKITTGAGSMDLVVLRKNAGGTQYEEQSRTTVAFAVGSNDIDVSASNIHVLLGDTYLLQYISGHSSPVVQTNVTAASGRSLAVITHAAPLVATISEVEGNAGNDASFLYEVDVRGDFSETTDTRVSTLETGQTTLTSSLNAVKYFDATGTSFPDNGFYTPAGSYNTSSNWRSVTVNVESGQVSYSVYSITGAAMVTFFNSSNVKISSVDAVGSSTAKQTGTVAVPAGAVKAVISTHITGINDSSYGYQVETTKKVVENSTVVSNKQDKPVIRTFTVSKTGTPSSTVFNTVAAALAAWTSGTQILIYDGIYEENSLNIPNGAWLKGVGVVEIRGYLPASSTTTDIDAKSTIDFKDSGTLENLIITAKNMRYPVHSDFGAAGAVQNVINCRIIHYGNREAYDYRVANSSASPNDAASVWRAMSAWGCGSSAGSKIYLKNTYLESPFRAFSTHNNAGYNLSNGASLIQCDNCDIVSSGIDRDGSTTSFAPSAFVQSLDSKTDDVVIFNNCRINGFLVLQSSTSDWREFTQRVQGGGNSSHLMQVRNSAGGSKTLTSQTTLQSVFIIKVRSNSANAITVSGNLVNAMFGTYTTLKGSTGLNSWIKAQVNANTAFASVNSYSGTKTITFVSGADTKTLTLSTTYTTATQLVNDMNTQFGAGSFVAELYWPGFDWYPNFTNEIATLKNTGTSAILRGRAVKKNGFNAIAPMTSSDAANTFYGIAVQDIPVGNMGDVKYAGYMLRIWADGLFGTALADNDMIKVNSDGTFSKSADGSGVIVSKCVSNENISINMP